MRGLTLHFWRPHRPFGAGARSGPGSVALLAGATLLLLGAPVVARDRGLLGGLLMAAVGLTAATLTTWRPWDRRRETTHADVAGRRGDARSTPAVAAHEDPLIVPGLSTALDGCEDMVALLDRTGRVAHANHAFASRFAETLRGPRSLTDAGVLAAWGTGREEFQAALVRLLAHPDERGSGELSHAGRDPRLFTWVSEPIYGADGTVAGRTVVLRDRSRERELTALKSDFLSTVTHELRTPLTSVKGSLQLILGKAAALAPIDRELLGISLKNADRLIRMINDLLDISRLELGKLELSFGTVPTAAMIEEAVAGLRAYASGRDVTVACELEPNLPAITGDRDRLIQVLTNLISNAVKFSPTGGRVLVCGARHGNELGIAVRDWGVGIPASDQGRLFQRFQRVNPGRSTEPGAGLGLAISKAIVDRHGGRIAVDSREDEGSTFTIVLPVVTPEGATSVGRDGERMDPAAGRPTLLLVDDDVDLGTVLEVSLRDSYRLLRVERGVQALDVARAERPDLVLLDVVLPDLSGYDVLRILQNSEATGDIPVVMMTVQPERELARSLGAIEVLAKPADIDTLRRIIGEILERRAAHAP